MYFCIKAFSGTGLTEDLEKFDKPTLKDQVNEELPGFIKG